MEGLDGVCWRGACSPKSSTKLRAASLLCLGQVAKHSAELAQRVVDEGVAMPTLNALLDASPAVRCNASLLVHECARKTQSVRAMESENSLMDKADGWLQRLATRPLGMCACLCMFVI